MFLGSRFHPGQTRHKQVCVQCEEKYTNLHVFSYTFARCSPFTQVLESRDSFLQIFSQSLSPCTPLLFRLSRALSLQLQYGSLCRNSVFFVDVGTSCYRRCAKFSLEPPNHSNAIKTATAAAGATTIKKASPTTRVEARKCTSQTTPGNVMKRCTTQTYLDRLCSWCVHHLTSFFWFVLSTQEFQASSWSKWHALTCMPSDFFFLTWHDLSLSTFIFPRSLPSWGRLCKGRLHLLRI